MKLKQNGVINSFLIPLVVITLLFIISVVFGFKTYQSRQDYKNNVDQKIADANAVVVKQTQTTDAQQYFDEAKRPLATYSGPATFGSIVVKYPKTWSAYVIEQDQGSPVINGYFEPGFVPDVGNQNNTFALRLQVNSQSYSSVLSQYTQQAQQGNLTVTPYVPVNIPDKFNVSGTKITGQLSSQVQGEMILLPFQGNMTFELWTESTKFESDFNNLILPNFTFSP